MQLDTNFIIRKINSWLKDTGVKVTLSEGGQRNEGLAVLELSGDLLTDLTERFGKMRLRWLLPDRTDDGCIVEDQVTGNKYSSGMIFRREEFKEKGQLQLCPDLDKGEVYPAWLHDIEIKWKRFAKSLSHEGKDGHLIKKQCTINDFVRLEAGLNSYFVSGTARAGARFNDDFIKKDENPLLVIENKRQVLIDLHARTLGRLRIPHSSHKGNLCPFQTPESDLTGLQLNLAIGAKVGNDGKFENDNDELFSLAVGLIPYPHHTDGPRLMMGGKNMKQAEQGIAGAEPPIVPGYYEGLKAQNINLNEFINQENLRFKTPIGLNALTLIMPYQGYTYEDGLVISQSLADRLCIEKKRYSYKRVIKAAIYHHDLEKIGLDENTLYKLGEWFSGTDKNYVYGDELPDIGIPLFKESNPKEEFNLHEKYNIHAPGILRSVDVKGILKETKGSKETRTKYYIIEISLCWNFDVKLKMGLGDKLTGRNGNKGVVTKILPDEQMPKIHFKDEIKNAELIISPSSIMGRKNLGQIWEMAHSLLIKKGGEKLRKIIDKNNLELSEMPLDGSDMQPVLDNFTELLQETGTDERGTFEISGNNIPKGTRAFAGWQYFCRLHHHAWKKLQARGETAPLDENTGQPIQCGARTGQRMGEMENWSFLSHGADDVLFAMRNEQTGKFNESRNFFKQIMRSLGIIVDEKDGVLTFGHRQPVKKDKAERKLKNVNLYDVLKNFDKYEEPVRASIQGRDCLTIIIEKDGKREAKKITDVLRGKTSDSEHCKKLADKLDDIINAHFFNEEEHKNSDGDIEKFYTLHIEPKLLNYKALRDALMPFALPKTQLSLRVEALINYHDELINLLKGKTGILKRFLLGRRYNHSGRAVIVPEPSLKLTEAYLPAAMLIELLDGYDHEIIFPKSIREMRKILNDSNNKKSNAQKIAKEINEVLSSENGELWCFLIRQPSLHRHNVQAFRIRCWAEPVIGIPPFVTPGFNADFDGDTMAVFLPPYKFAKDLSAFSIINNPGLVGTGDLALATGLDLALGWWSSQENNTKTKLSEYLKEFVKEKNADELQKLQLEICQASTGSATLTPLEFENLCNSLPKDIEQKEAENTLKSLLEQHKDYGLSIMLNSGAKGKISDVLQMVWHIGNVEKMKDQDGNETENVFIDGNFWRGLSDDELFLYSYPSRYSMAQKKLSVADAGYFTRQLADGLYEYTVSEHDCGTDEGITITYADNKLLVDGFVFPTSGNVEKDLMRIAWGRVRLGQDKCLKEEDMKQILQEIKNGGELKLRSPLHCKDRTKGHVCSLCYGADIAEKPYNSPVPVTENFAAGITAAQAIGERGTQLAMKRFHDVSGGGQQNNTEKYDALHEMRQLFVTGKKEAELLQELFDKILGDKQHQRNAELPQALIHYEVVSAQAWNDTKNPGLRNVAKKDNESFLSALTGGTVKEFLTQKDFTDNLKTIKSRLIWKGEE